MTLVKTPRSQNFVNDCCESLLTYPVPIPDEEKKIKLNFYFHTSLWCLRFYEGFLNSIALILLVISWTLLKQS